MLVALGDLLELDGEDEEAAECFRRAATTDPDSEAATLNLVRALMLEEKFGEAEIQLSQALRRHPYSEALTKILGTFLSAKDVLPRQTRRSIACST